MDDIVLYWLALSSWHIPVLFCCCRLLACLSSTYEQLEEIVKLASQPLPERPDGIVAVAKYSKASPASSDGEDCRATEAEYERLARQNPATLFLRCFAEYENAAILIAQAQVVAWPTFDVFYGGAYLLANVVACVCVLLRV